MRSTKNTLAAEHHMQHRAGKGELELRGGFVNSAAFQCNNMHDQDDPGIQVTSVRQLNSDSAL